MSSVSTKVRATLVAVLVALSVGYVAPAANAAPAPTCRQVINAYLGATSPSQLYLNAPGACPTAWYEGADQAAIRLSGSFGQAAVLLQKGRAADIAAAKNIVAKDWAAIIKTAMPSRRADLMAYADKKVAALTKASLISHYKVMLNYTTFMRVRDEEAKVLAALLSANVSGAKGVTVTLISKAMKISSKLSATLTLNSTNTTVLNVILISAF